ncbi:MAG TPA: hypothetical protein VGM68_12655 [Rhizomicrobium sp.]
MKRDDYILGGALLAALVAIVLVAFAPAAVPKLGLAARAWSVAEHPITIAVVSTFIAAFAGTWGAQRLADRTARRKALLDEIRGTNMAIGLTYNIANTYFATKKQHIRQIVAHYDGQCAARTAHYAGMAVGTIPAGTPFTYGLELKTIFPPFTPIEELQKLMRDKIAPDGKALILMTPLIQSLRGFADTVTQRNEWIEELKHLPPNTDDYKGRLYFGLELTPGRTDERYPNFMKAIGLQTDDCIAFSLLIAESLQKYGARLAAKYGEGAPKISAPNFSKAKDLMPDMAFYADWTES